jgi:hypothetical protein
MTSCVYCMCDLRGPAFVPAGVKPPDLGCVAAEPKHDVQPHEGVAEPLHATLLQAAPKGIPHHPRPHGALQQAALVEQRAILLAQLNEVIHIHQARSAAFRLADKSGKETAQVCQLLHSRSRDQR